MSSISSYKEFYPETNHQFICGLCYEGSVNEKPRWVCHNGDGSKHPIHFDCAKLLEDNGFKKCATCRIEIDASYLFSLKEKCFKELKIITNEALLGSILATTIVFISFIFEGSFTAQVVPSLVMVFFCIKYVPMSVYRGALMGMFLHARLTLLENLSPRDPNFLELLILLNSIFIIGGVTGGFLERRFR